MPTLLTPPGIDRERERIHLPHDGDNGSGRRPPTDKRTGGNGDGDNWNDRPTGHRGPRERISRARVGILFTLFIVAMLFVGLAGAFLVTKSNGHFDAHEVWVKEWRPTHVPRILWLNTLLLLVSSLTAEFARRSMFREHELMEEWLGLGNPISRRATIWLSITLALGLTFIAGQLRAWAQLVQHHITLRSNPSSTFFYLLTASHAVHLLAGVIALVTAITILQRSRTLATRQVWVDTTTWYWHAMGILWIFFFLLLEYGQ